MSTRSGKNGMPTGLGFTLQIKIYYDDQAYSEEEDVSEDGYVLSSREDEENH